MLNHATNLKVWNRKDFAMMNLWRRTLKWSCHPQKQWNQLCNVRLQICSQKLSSVKLILHPKKWLSPREKSSNSSKRALANLLPPSSRFTTTSRWSELARQDMAAVTKAILLPKKILEFIQFGDMETTILRWIQSILLRCRAPMQISDQNNLCAKKPPN